MRLTALSLCLALVLLTACGIKPSKLDPPAGTPENVPYPRTYPVPAGPSGS